MTLSGSSEHAATAGVAKMMLPLKPMIAALILLAAKRFWGDCQKCHAEPTEMRIRVSTQFILFKLCIKGPAADAQESNGFRSVFGLKQHFPDDSHFGLADGR